MKIIRLLPYQLLYFSSIIYDRTSQRMDKWKFKIENCVHSGWRKLTDIFYEYIIDVVGNILEFYVYW